MKSGALILSFFCPDFVTFLRHWMTRIDIGWSINEVWKNATTKRKHKTLPLMGATRPASGFLRQRLTDKRAISAVCKPLFDVWAFALMPDAGRVAPISACAW